MSATFEGNDPVLFDNLKLPPLPKPIYEITFPVYTIPATYNAWANDKGWGVEKTSGPMPERVAEKKFTNFERLRTLNVEEMAIEIVDYFEMTFDDAGLSRDCALQGLVDWLRQEVEDGEHEQS